MQETRVQSLGQEHPLEKGIATHTSILHWRIPQTGEPHGLQSTGLQRLGHSWAANTRMQHSFLMKILSKLGLEWKFLSVVKGIYKNLTANIKQNVSLLKSGTRQRNPLLPILCFFDPQVFVFHQTWGVVSHCYLVLKVLSSTVKQEKEIQKERKCLIL